MCQNISPQVPGTAVSQNDTSPLTRISGVGSKTAERLILELKSKKELLFGAVGEQAAKAEQVETPDVGSEAQSALTSLGYSAFQARETIEAIIGKSIKFGTGSYNHSRIGILFT